MYGFLVYLSTLRIRKVVIWKSPVFRGIPPLETQTAWLLNKEMSSRDSSTQISSIFRHSGKIKPPGHRHAFCVLPWPRPGLVLSIPKNSLFSHTAESSLQIELVAPGQAWPQSSISARELPPQSRFRREGCIQFDTQDQFPYT